MSSPAQILRATTHAPMGLDIRAPLWGDGHVSYVVFGFFKVVLVVVVIAGLLLLDRFLATLGLASITFLLYWRLGANPTTFYQEWLLAHPRLRLETRAATPRLALQPDLRILALILLATVFVPLVFSATFSLAVMFLIAVVFVQFMGMNQEAGSSGFNALYRLAAEVRKVYVAYPDANAAGLWHGGEPLSRRRFYYHAPPAMLFMTLASSLTLFCPWELFASWFVPGFTGSVVAASAYHPLEWARFQAAAVQVAHPGYYVAVIVAIVVGIILPKLLTFALCVPVLRQLLEFRERLDRLDVDTRTPWECHVDRLRSSERASSGINGKPFKERDHFFMGFHSDNSPALLHRSILNEHGYIAGAAGKGKTSAGIMPLIIQLVRGQSGTNDGIESPPPILILDLKGDDPLFFTARKEAEKRGQQFRYFTCEEGYASHHFDIFHNLSATTRSPADLCGLFIQALSLYHGDYYGASFYSRQNRDLLLSVLQGHRPRTWKDLYELVLEAQRADRRRFRDTYELLSAVHALTFYRQLNPPPPGKDSIDMRDALSRGQMVYFRLPALHDTMAVKEVGKLALYAFLTAARERRRPREGAAPQQAYIFIDEFQMLVAQNIQSILQQARSFGVSLIMVNQSPSDLIVPHLDLRKTVMTNTRFKQFFTLDDEEEAKRLVFLSGTKIEQRESVSHSTRQSSSGFDSGSSTTQSYNPVEVPKLHPNTIQYVTKTPLASLVHVTWGEGHTDYDGVPQVVQTMYPLPAHAYNLRYNKRWPQDQTATEQTEPSAVVEQQRSAWFAQDERLRLKLKALQEEEGRGDSQDDPGP